MRVLSDELTNDPLGRGYSGMTHQEAADNLNTKYRTRNKKYMTSSDVFNAINKTEYNGLTVANQTMVWNILHLGSINPFGLEATIFSDIFGVGSSTIIALQSLRNESISRATELGVYPNPVKPGHIQMARS